MPLVCFNHKNPEVTGAIQPNKPSAIFHTGPSWCHNPKSNYWQINRSGDKITHRLSERVRCQTNIWAWKVIFYRHLLAGLVFVMSLEGIGKCIVCNPFGEPPVLSLSVFRVCTDLALSVCVSYFCKRDTLML